MRGLELSIVLHSTKTIVGREFNPYLITSQHRSISPPLINVTYKTGSYKLMWVCQKFCRTCCPFWIRRYALVEDEGYITKTRPATFAITTFFKDIEPSNNEMTRPAAVTINCIAWRKM